MPKSESRPNSIVVEFVEEPFMAPQMETPQTLKESAESPAAPGCATPNLFGNAAEATQYYAVHGPPQLWPVPSLVWVALPEVQQDQKVQKSGEDTPTYLGTFEQSQRLWEASCRPSVQPLLPPPEIQRVLDVVAEQQREALRAQHQQMLLALEPVVAERAAEEAKEAKEAVAEVAELALENVEPQSLQEAEPTVEVPSVSSSESELPRASSTCSTCSTASSICCNGKLNGQAPKFRPGMEECPYVAIGQSCRTSKFSGFGRCKSYLEGKCTRKKCKFCHCLADVKH